MFYQYQHFGASEYFCKERGKDFVFPSHIHRSFELITVLSGTMAVTVGDREYILNPDEAVLVFPNQLHSLSSEDCEHLLLIFSEDIVMAYCTRHTDEIPKSNKLKLSKRLGEDILGLCESDSIIKKKGILYSLCASLDEQTEYMKKDRSDGDLLQMIFGFVEENYMNECSLEAMHKALGYSTSYLSRYFSNVTGSSFLSFVNRYRISRACYLLANTTKSVLECAMDCGYTSLRSFNRNFQVFVEMTPCEYRRLQSNQ